MKGSTYLTTQRKVIYQIVSDSLDHPTAADVMEQLRQRGHNFAYGTVYNSLRYLVDEGLIRELKLGDSASRYDARTQKHYHIVCTQCGRLDEVFFQLPLEWVEQVEKETSFTIMDEQLVIRGVCSKCKAMN